MVKKSKKGLACLLAVLMLLSAVPVVNVFAWNTALTYYEDTANKISQNYYSAYVRNGVDYAGFYLTGIDKNRTKTVEQGSSFSIELACGLYTTSTYGSSYPLGYQGWHYGGNNSNTITGHNTTTDYDTVPWAAYLESDLNKDITSTITGSLVNVKQRGTALRSIPPSWNGTTSDGSANHATGTFNFTPESFPQLNQPGTYTILLAPTIVFANWSSDRWSPAYGWGDFKNNRTSDQIDSRTIKITLKVRGDFVFRKNDGTTKNVTATSYEEALAQAPANSTLAYVDNHDETHQKLTYSWPASISGEASAGKANVSFYTTIADGSATRGSNNNMCICSDGQAGNTTAGILKFNIADIPPNVTEAKLNLNYKTLGFSGEEFKLVAIDSNGVITNSPQATGNFNEVFPSAKTTNSRNSFNDALNYFNTNEDRTVVSFPAKGNDTASYWPSSATTKSFDITNAVSEARKANKTELVLLAMVPVSNRSTDGNAVGWSDINIYPDNSNISWSYQESATINEVETSVTEDCSYTSSSTKPSTCTVEGTTTHYCDKCNSVKTETLPLAQHNPGDWTVQTSASCTQEGTRVKRCTVCNNIVATEPIPMIEHSWDEGEVTTEPTCTTQGVRTFTCTECDATKTEPIDIINHAFTEEATADADGQSTLKTEATCTANAVYYKTCSMCQCSSKDITDETWTEADSTVPHTFGEWDITDPTCTVAGSKTRECSVCHEIETEVIPATGIHTEVTDAAIPATCTRTGKTEGSHCSVCGEVFVEQKDVPMLEHEETTKEEITVQPSCTEKGSKVVITYCTVCGNETAERETVELSALGHQFGEWDVTTNATCGADGEKRRDCERCDAFETETIPATGNHTESTKENVIKEATCLEKGSKEIITFCTVCKQETADRQTVEIPTTDVHTPVSAGNAVDATCESAGKEADTVCSVCGEKLATGNVIDALGHDYVEAITTPATCKEAGLKTFTCQNDATHTYTEVIPATGKHTPVSANNGVAATCESAGKESDTICSVCRDTLETGATIEALGHDWDEGNVIKDSSCKEAGEMAYTCKRDGAHTKTEEIATKPHTPITDPAVAPTCSSEGKTEGSHCSVCNEVITAQTVVEKLPHTEEIIPGFEATCQTEGLTDGKKCTVCGETFVVQTVIEKLPHSTATREENRIEATCQSEGSYELITYCTVCDEEISRKFALIRQKNHEDKDNDGRCDFCNEILAVNIPESDDCLCHEASKNSFFGFVYKIFLMFWKIFGINKVCDCGIVHY